MKSKKFLKGRRVAHSFIAGALVLLLLFAFLPGCAPEVAPPPEEEEEVVSPPVEPGPYEKYVASLPAGCEPVPRDCFEQAMEEGQLNIYDWAEWWPEEMYPAFEKEFGIKIVRDNFADYDEMVTKYKLNPKLEYDYLLPDFRAFEQLRALGVVGELNHDWIPNVNKYLREDIKNIKYDPGYKYGVIAYLTMNGYTINTAYLDETDPRVGSWAYIFEAPKDLPEHGRLIMKNDMFQTIGAVLIYLGYSYNSDDKDELMEAKEVLMRLKPYVKAYHSWPKREILTEETWLLGPYGTGEILWLSEDVPTLKAILPEEGSFVRGAVMLMPKHAPHPALAHLWINFWFRPDVALALAEITGRTPSNTAVPALLPEKVRTWVGVEPPEGYLEICEFPEARGFTGKGLELRTEIWEDLMT